MITQTQIKEILRNYGSDIHVGSLGGHSALDICRGAKQEGLGTVVVAQKGREKAYAKYYKTSSGKGCVDEVIVVDKFSDITEPEIQQRLRQLNTVFVHSRYFWVYCDFNEIENNFRVPIFGSRMLVRKEERDEEKNQYYLLQQAGIRTPKIFAKPQDIDRLVIVKVAEASRGYERAFFLARDYSHYEAVAKEKIRSGEITAAALKTAVIEEYAIGPQINLNFFYSPLSGEVELLGTDMRRQTNIDGLLRLTAPEQTEVLKHLSPKYIETGHIAVTMKESLLEKAFELGEKFVAATKEFDPGIIGPFALQGAVVAEEGKEEFVIFDVSMRIPGSPGTMFTPYSGYLWGENMSMGRRIAREIKAAMAANKLGEIVT